MTGIKFPKIEIEPADMDRLENIVKRFEDSCNEIIHKTHVLATNCVWTYVVDDEDEYWSTSCGEEFVTIEGTPKENGNNFCPSCGNPLVEFYPQESED